MTMPPGPPRLLPLHVAGERYRATFCRFPDKWHQTHEYHHAYRQMVTALARDHGVAVRTAYRAVAVARRYALPVLPETLDLAAFAALYNDTTMTYGELAAHFYVSTRTIHRGVLEARSRGLITEPRDQLNRINAAAVSHLYRLGLSYRQIGDQLAYGWPAVARVVHRLVERGLLSPRAPHLRGPKDALRADADARARLYLADQAAGLSLPEIAAKHGRTRSAVAGVIRRYRAHERNPGKRAT